MRIEGNDQRLAAATATNLQVTGTQKMLAAKYSQQHDPSKTNPAMTVPPAADKVSIKVELPKNTVETLSKMGNISDFLNTVATNIRKTNDGLSAASSIVEQMKASLDKIIKNYPPYSLESKERIEQLMSYSSLKKQIVSLMVPAPPPPLYEKVQHLWEDLFTAPNGAIQTPTLPTTVPDSHVKAAADQLGSLSGQIALVQETLGNTVKVA